MRNLGGQTKSIMVFSKMAYVNFLQICPGLQVIRCMYVLSACMYCLLITLTCSPKAEGVDKPKTEDRKPKTEDRKPKSAKTLFTTPKT